MDVLKLIAVTLFGALIVQISAYFYALYTKRVDIIDACWGLSFIAGIVAMQFFSPSFELWIVLVDTLVVVWGLRLSWHIYRRFKKSTIQDKRYTQMISKWPKKYKSMQLLLRIFLVQAALVTTISLVIITVHSGPTKTSWLGLAGSVLWTIGYVFEATADNQLKKFLSKANHPELMTEGLWRYSRHPNYFGELTMWWGIALIACQTPHWWLGFIGALTITILILFVSGVPLAEYHAKNKKGWENYKRKTSPLIPWLPKK